MEKATLIDRLEAHGRERRLFYQNGDRGRELALEAAQRIREIEGRGLDHRKRAIDFHRRAQAAEGAEIRARHEAWFWHDAWRRVVAGRRTLKRNLSRTRAQLRAGRWTDPLTRIVELGRIFP